MIKSINLHKKLIPNQKWFLNFSGLNPKGFD